MKIESITLKDFKCFENLQLQLTKPVSLFFGRNAAGKTSL
ncbi:MAG: AAA family ATPase, partial [Deltaproteobacteria bacterium]|nr:AAA family ATPase [Deltaproteobacteria bacterium]